MRMLPSSGFSNRRRAAIRPRGTGPDPPGGSTTRSRRTGSASSLRILGRANRARAAARAARDWTRADALRDELTAAGVVVEDSPAGARWHLA